MNKSGGRVWDGSVTLCWVILPELPEFEDDQLMLSHGTSRSAAAPTHAVCSCRAVSAGDLYLRIRFYPRILLWSDFSSNSSSPGSRRR